MASQNLAEEKDKIEKQLYTDQNIKLEIKSSQVSNDNDWDLSTVAIRDNHL